MHKPTLICLDLEGVLVPEIWHSVATQTGIADFGLTTRDIDNYDTLMQHRLALLSRHQLTLDDIQAVIATMQPLPGAQGFLDSLRAQFQVVILSDTFYQFAQPLMAQLNWPTLFCHQLITNAQNHITGYQLRQQESKQVAVKSFQKMALRVLAAGDSYNDLSMLKAADQGYLFRAPEPICAQYPEFATVQEYRELLQCIANSEVTG